MHQDHRIQLLACCSPSFTQCAWECCSNASWTQSYFWDFYSHGFIKDSEEHTLFPFSKKGLAKAECNQQWPPFMVVTWWSQESLRSVRITTGIGHGLDKNCLGVEGNKLDAKFWCCFKTKECALQIKQNCPKHLPRTCSSLSAHRAASTNTRALNYSVAFVIFSQIVHLKIRIICLILGETLLLLDMSFDAFILQFSG